MFEASTSAVSNIPCDPDTVLSSDAVCNSDTVFTDVVCDCDTAVVAISDILRSFCTVAAVVSVAPIFSDAIVTEFSDVLMFSDALMVSDVPMVSDFTCGCWNTGSSVSSVTSEICTFAMSSSAEAVFISPGLSGSVKISSTCGFSSTSIFETASSNA